MTQEAVLQIQMLGGFQVSYGQIEVVARNSRNSKVLQLFAYLVCNRDEMIRQDELIGILLRDEESENPVGMLKNLVYRLRKTLEAAGVTRACIQYKKGAYGFCSAVPCTVDIERFSQRIQNLRENPLPDDEALAQYLEAVELYDSGFLPRFSREPWVVGYAVRYQGMYGECLERACALANHTGKQERLLPYLRKAVKLYPYEETLAVLYLDTLYRAKRVKEALEAYEAICATLLNDLGIGPTERLRQQFDIISSGVQEVTPSVVEVRSRMAEAKREPGAYFCNLEVFTSLYRFVLRHMERSTHSVYLMLCTLKEEDGEALPTGERMRKVSESFCAAVKESLRRGDTYTRYSSSQFVLMLMEIKQEDCDGVAQRIRHRFHRFPKMGRVQLDFKCISAADTDEMMERRENQALASW